MTILAGVAQVTQDFWHIEYLAQHLEPGREHYIIHQFGTRRMTPWYFPFVWLYVLAGICKLLSLMHHHAGYHVILAQDGVVTGAFAALAGKLAGVRVVCIDHGDLSLLLDRNSRIYRNERIAAAAAKPWPVRLVARRLFVLYWPSRYLLARIAARFVDHYLIPGISGDGVDEMCKQLGVHPSRITRFGNMIDIDRHLIPDDLLRAEIREKYGIAVDAIVIAIVCRLAVEKGLEIALEAVSQALFALPPSLHTRIRVVIVGDGPIRKQLEEDIRTLGLNRICMLWGEAQAGEVISILGISNIFLYTSWRGAGYPLAIMEAMASGCAVIASTEPLANEYMLADGRGIVVPVGDIEQTSAAIMRLASDLELCRQMGNLARNYIALYHSPALFRRTLVRAAYWSALDDLLGATKIETLRSKSGNRL